jgi:hypothetical protein
LHFQTSMSLKQNKPPVEVCHSIEQPSTLQQLPQWPAPLPAPARRPVAVLVCHGMGQQVPFETITGIASRLQAATAPPAQVRQVHFVDTEAPSRTQWLPRAEIHVPDPTGAPDQPVHVYEAYWAPLTEGVISLTEVVQFLVSAGLGSLWRSFTLLPLGLRRFERWVFGEERNYGVRLLTPIALFFTLGVVAGLVAINTILTLVLATHAAGLAAAGQQTVLLAELTTDLLWLLGAAGATLGLLGMSMWRHNRGVKSSNPTSVAFGALELLGLVALGLLLLAIMGIGGAMTYHFLTLRTCSLAGHRTLSITGAVPTFSIATVALVWAGAAGASFAARKFLVQYMGDVAIYLNSHKVDKFHAVRQQIKALTFGTACTLYSARDKHDFAYDRVVLVGHSLGSVVAYDTLNAMLNLDETMMPAAPLHVAGRTSALITYGSPLDKTAFLFDLQHPEAPMRDALAASVQPLIRNQIARGKISWVNIYSKLDVISGSLEFYQLPRLPESVEKYPQVTNLQDPQAITPLMAHAQYSSNPLLLQKIKAAIFE